MRTGHPGTSLVPVAMAAILSACATAPVPPPIPWTEKITLDLSAVNEHGLTGPPGGLRALSYEFCIPDTERHRAEVRALDPTVMFQGGSPGRIGCGPDQCLCIGMTHQPGFREVLRNLAQRPYIQRIDPCWFE